MKHLELREMFVARRAKGLSFAKISEELNVSKQTLISWSKEMQTEIANLKSIELEHLQQQYFMTRTSRIAMLGDLLTQVREELSQRDLADVPTDKLASMLITISKALDTERTQLSFQSRESKMFNPVEDLFQEKITEWSV